MKKNVRIYTIKRKYSLANQEDVFNLANRMVKYSGLKGLNQNSRGFYGRMETKIIKARKLKTQIRKGDLSKKEVYKKTIADIRKDVEKGLYDKSNKKNADGVFVVQKRDGVHISVKEYGTRKPKHYVFKSQGSQTLKNLVQDPKWFVKLRLGKELYRYSQEMFNPKYYDWLYRFATYMDVVPTDIEEFKELLKTNN